MRRKKISTSIKVCTVAMLTFSITLDTVLRLLNHGFGGV
ncbi:hypothetical protein PAECIP111890_04046 [Paenibacillus sp. JJ-223]|nr:hypothetical protein PAECIP111890_04046 [Paenibacillus sp. JJ-223]